MQLTTSGGDANFSGVELWKSTAAAVRQVATAQQLSTSSQPAQLFPNPSHDGRFTLLLPTAFQQGSTYTLLTALGSTLAVGTLTPEQTVADLNFSQLLTASGVYYLHLQSKSQSTYLKLLRE